MVIRVLNPSVLPSSERSSDLQGRSTSLCFTSWDISGLDALGYLGVVECIACGPCRGVVGVLYVDWHGLPSTQSASQYSETPALGKSSEWLLRALSERTYSPE